MLERKNPRMFLVSYKGHCTRKLKLIKNFVEENKEGPAPEDRQHFQGLAKDLKVQMDRLEAAWHEISGGVTGDAALFEELDNLVTDTAMTVEETMENCRRFLKKKPAPPIGSETSPTVTSSGACGKTTVKLATFWPEEADLWFSRAEASFHTENVTTEVSKFSNVIAHLDSSTAGLAGDIIKTVPREDENPYTKLKTRILEALSLSTDEKADKLIAMSGFGDKNPSQGLQAMLKLVPEEEAENPGFLFRRFFLLQLAPDVRNSLAQTEHTASTVDSLRQLAKQADRYYHSTGARINAIAASGGSDVEELSVDAVAGKVLCQFHKKFGHKAWTCSKNKGKRCDWTGKLASRPQGNASGRA